MPQNWTDNIPDFQNIGGTYIQSMRNNFIAVKSSFSGSGSPPNPPIGMPWFWTTQNTYRILTATGWKDVAFAVPGTGGGKALDAAKCSDISIIAGAGMTGGGALSQNCTISHSPHTGDVVGTTALTFTPMVAGTHQIFSMTGDQVNLYAFSQVANSTLRLFRAGVVTTRLGIKRNFSSNSISLQIYRNGAPVGALRTSASGLWAYYNENISVSAGDVLSLYGQAGGIYQEGPSHIFCIGIGNPLENTPGVLGMSDL